MSVTRIIGLIFLTLAFIALTADAVRALDSGYFQPRSLGETWFMLHASSLNFSQAIVQRYLLPELWDPVIASILRLPAALNFSVVGVALLIMSRRRR
jgi:hypothetical protein